MKKSDFLLIAEIVCFICGATLFTIHLIRGDCLLYSIIPLGLCFVLLIVDSIKGIVQKKD